MITLENSFSNDELFLAFPKPEQAGRIISSVIHNYYSDVEKPVIFDKNRSWTNRLHYINGYFGVAPKVLCPVRNIDEILTSFIQMRRRSMETLDETGKINFLDEMLIKNGIPLNDDNRCQVLSGPNGILGQSYQSLKQVIMEGNQKCLHFIEYDDLVNSPDETMRKIYEFLDEQYFEHDFSSLTNIHQERDALIYGIPDMHDVRSSLEKASADPKEVLSELTLERSANSEFWRNLNEEYDPEKDTTDKDDFNNEGK
jgi:sulfotransferase